MPRRNPTPPPRPTPEQARARNALALASGRVNRAHRAVASAEIKLQDAKDAQARVRDPEYVHQCRVTLALANKAYADACLARDALQAGPASATAHTPKAPAPTPSLDDWS